MPTRNVVLTDQQAELVSGLVSSGAYQNASEAIRAGLRLLEADIARRDAAIEGLRAGVAEGLAQYRAGDLADGEAGDVIRRTFGNARS